jgi:MFS family permease
VGLVAGIYRPAAQALIADIVEPADRARAYGLQYWALNAGFSGAALLAGVVVAAGGFGLFFVLDAATCLAFGGIVLVGIREPRHVREASLAEAGGDGGWGVPLRDPLLLWLCGLTLASGAIYFQGYTTLPLAMRDDGLGAGAYGAAIAVNGIAIIIIQPLILRRVQALDRGLVLAASSVLVGAGFGALALVSSRAGYALAVLVWTIGEILATAVLPALVASLAPAHLRGRYLGLWGASFGGSFVFAPSLGTAIYANAGPNVLWAGCALLGCLLAFGYLALERAGEGRVAQPAAAT